MRIAHRWDAIQEEADAMEEARHCGKEYNLVTFANGDTRKQLLARSRYLMFKSSKKWTESQKQRAFILFQLYPDIKEAYSLTHSLRMIFNKTEMACYTVIGDMSISDGGHESRKIPTIICRACNATIRWVYVPPLHT